MALNADFQILLVFLHYIFWYPIRTQSVRIYPFWSKIGHLGTIRYNAQTADRWVNVTSQGPLTHCDFELNISAAFGGFAWHNRDWIALSLTMWFPAHFNVLLLADFSFPHLKKWMLCMCRRILVHEGQEENRGICPQNRIWWRRIWNGEGLSPVHLPMSWTAHCNKSILITAHRYRHRAGTLAIVLEVELFST